MTVTNATVAKLVNTLRPVLQEAVAASETRIRQEIAAAEMRLRKEFEQAGKNALKTQQQELEAHIKSSNQAQTAEITGYVADIVDRLDDAFAEKETEQKVEQIRTHLHATP